MEPVVAARVTEELGRYLNTSPGEIQFSPQGGGSINQAFRVTCKQHSFFLKLNSSGSFPGLFVKEAGGLRRISSAGSMATPEIIACFEAGEKQLLLLKWVEAGEMTAQFWKKFGSELAAMHQVHAMNFGLEEDNYMGSVKQVNEWEISWIDFFREKRLEPMILLCEDLLEAKHKKGFESLFRHLDKIFEPEAQPCLVHGDLWSGNFLCDQQNAPVLIDPAVYYGHPSVDLGMTTLFGGFKREFYESYHYHSSLAPNYREQWKVANLYPLLIHLNLFGSSYLARIDQTLSEFK
jgi:protein-ribulosamine 3-kinase